MHPLNMIDDDAGFALATVMGAVAVITAIALGGFFMSQNALGESLRVSNENRAYQAASSGLEREMAVFTPFQWSTGVSASGYTYGTTQTINNSDWIVVTVRSGDTDAALGEGEYEMVSIGGSQGASETVSVRFQSFNLWDMNISGDEGSAMGSGAGLNGNGTIIGKVYCNGDFEWTGNGSLEGGPVFVRSGVFDKQSVGSNVGYADDRINVYFDNPPIGQTGGYYADLKGTAPKLVIPWPTQSDMDVWRNSAIADSAANVLGDGTGLDGTVRHDASASDSQYNVFNGNVTLSAAAPFGKPGPKVTSEGTIIESASGDVIAVGSDGTLHLNGLTYIDGSLTVASSVVRYSGRGLIVAREGITFQGTLVPAAYNPSAATEELGAYTLHEPTGTKMPKTTVVDCAGFASLGGVVQNTSGWVCAAVFANGSYTAPASGAKFRGSIIAKGIDFSLPNSWLASQTGMSENLPDGLPPLNNLNAMSDWERH